MTGTAASRQDAPRPVAPIKLIVWDLDDTLWDGTLLEGDRCALRPEIVGFIQDMDARGVLHSIASRNDAATAVAHLEKHGVRDLFLYPQIGWGAKSQGVARIAEQLNIGLDAALFVDDSDFELAEASSLAPELRTLNVARVDELLRDATLRGLAVTDESRRRRQMYLEDARRAEAERDSADTSDAFLATLDLRLDCRVATEADLVRAEELVNRTNQLNSTGMLFSQRELTDLIQSPHHAVLVAAMRDRFGDYGTIALVVLETGAERWRVELILVSCRVMSRGIGPILLRYLAARARQAGRTLGVAFRDTGRNRAMKVAVMLAGLVREADTADFTMPPGAAIPEVPSWLAMTSTW